MNSKKGIIFLVMGSLLWLVVPIGIFMSATSESVRFLGLAETTNSIIVMIVFPWILGCVLVILIPRIVSGLYLMLISGGKPSSSVKYIEMESESLNIGKIIGRMFSLFLLTLGLTQIFLEAGFLDPTSFMTQTKLAGWMAEVDAGVTVNFQYNPGILLQMLCIIIPIAMGIFGIVWALEDAGLLFYKLPKTKEEKQLYEIRPVHAKFALFLKGVGGIMSIMYYINAFQDAIAIGRSNMDLLLLIVDGFIVLSIFPVYLVYSLVGVKSLRKGLKVAPIISEDEFHL
ncbi:MAG: hypothetical protein GY870_11330 [archaeon]|nr:hypothetical protein [archaeon]